MISAALDVSWTAHLDELAGGLELANVVGEHLLPRSRQVGVLLAHDLRDGVQG